MEDLSTLISCEFKNIYFTCFSWIYLQWNSSTSTTSITKWSRSFHSLTFTDKHTVAKSFHQFYIWFWCFGPPNATNCISFIPTKFASPVTDCCEWKWECLSHYNVSALTATSWCLCKADNCDFQAQRIVSNWMVEKTQFWMEHEAGQVVTFVWFLEALSWCSTNCQSNMGRIYWGNGQPKVFLHAWTYCELGRTMEVQHSEDQNRVLKVKKNCWSHTGAVNPAQLGLKKSFGIFARKVFYS